jgi:hypothetical protein
MDMIFLVFTAAVAVGVAAIISVYLTGHARRVGLAGLAVWLVYSGTLGYLGLMAGPWHGIQGPAFILLPVVLFVALFLSRSETAAKLAMSIPLALLLGAQAYRVIVEVFLHALAASGLAPRMLTYEGANFDILIGFSAVVVAWAYSSGRLSDRAALAWNIVGLGMLANVVVRAILTTPGPLNLLASEVPNQVLGRFPYTFIPGLMAPLAVTLHVLAIRALRARMRGQRKSAGLAVESSRR